MADGVEQIAEDIGKDLPEGAFKRTALLIEDVAEKVEAAAHFTDSAIDKVCLSLLYSIFLSFSTFISIIIFLLLDYKLI